MGRRVLITGLDTFWGGRMAQALEAKPEVEMILGLGHQGAQGPPRAHRVRPVRPEVLDPQPHRPGHPGGHHRPHLPRDQLVGGAGPGPPRDQRHRHPQSVGGGRGQRDVGAQGDRQVLHPRLRRGRTGPRVVPRGGHPDRAGAHQAGAVAHRGGVLGAGLRRGQPPSGGDRPAVRQRPRHRHHHPDQL